MAHTVGKCAVKILHQTHKWIFYGRRSMGGTRFHIFLEWGIWRVNICHSALIVITRRCKIAATYGFILSRLHCEGGFISAALFIHSFVLSYLHCQEGILSRYDVARAVVVYWSKNGSVLVKCVKSTIYQRHQSIPFLCVHHGVRVVLWILLHA